MKRNLIYKTILCIETNNSRRIPSNKTPNPMCKGNQNENIVINTPPINLTKDRFPVIPQTINIHYGDPRRLNNHPNPPNKHQTEKTRQRGWCTRLFKETDHMYAACRRTTHIYTWLPNKKPHICFKNKARQGRRLKNSDPEWTEPIKQWYDKKHNRNESNLRRKKLQTPSKKILSPVWSLILLRGKSLYG